MLTDRRRLAGEERMHSDLEAIVAADEEARSRIQLAETSRDRDLDAARAARDAAVEARRNAAQEALDHELRTIRDEGDRRLAELRAQQQAFLAAVSAAAETKFDEAVAAYVRIVGGAA
jgi:DNA anti-recombination protein RmuC